MLQISPKQPTNRCSKAQGVKGSQAFHERRTATANTSGSSQAGKKLSKKSEKIVGDFLRMFAWRWWGWWWWWWGGWEVHLNKMFKKKHVSTFWVAYLNNKSLVYATQTKQGGSFLLGKKSNVFHRDLLQHHWPQSSNHLLLVVLGELPPVAAAQRALEAPHLFCLKTNCWGKQLFFSGFCCRVMVCFFCTNILSK